MSSATAGLDRRPCYDMGLVKGHDRRTLTKKRYGAEVKMTRHGTMEGEQRLVLALCDGEWVQVQASSAVGP